MRHQAITTAAGLTVNVWVDESTHDVYATPSVLGSLGLEWGDYPPVARSTPWIGGVSHRVYPVPANAL